MGWPLCKDPKAWPKWKSLREEFFFQPKLSFASPLAAPLHLAPCALCLSYPLSLSMSSQSLKPWQLQLWPALSWASPHVRSSPLSKPSTYPFPLKDGSFNSICLCTNSLFRYLLNAKSSLMVTVLLHRKKSNLDLAHIFWTLDPSGCEHFSPFLTSDLS